MMQALVTVIAPIRHADWRALQERIESLGNPARPDIRERLDRLDGEQGIHFMSLHALPTTDDSRAHLVLEVSGDGTEADVLARVARHLAPELEALFRDATDWRGGVLGEYLQNHRVTVGHGWTALPGLCFSGTPGMTVGRIRDEAALAEELTDLVAAQERGARPIDRLEAVRETIRNMPDRAWALVPPATEPPYRPRALLPALIRAGLRTYLWPVGAVLALGAIIALCTGGLAGAAGFVLVGLPWALAIVAILAGYGYFRLRRAEASDWVSDRAPDRATLAKIRARENHYAQNHMVSVTTRKPGWVRAVTLRLAFFVVAVGSRARARPGHLGKIGTIHFARWVTVPGTRDLLFFSNFGGSWESYLEDFITRAHSGLTSVWSNTVGFPRSRNLFQDGATDGERFKRYARASMMHTPFWYSAYPELTTSHIRRNAALRRGLAAALTNDEAKYWLAQIGSAPRPAAALESDQIQSLAFGGLGFLPEGTCLLLRLSADRQAARDLLATLLPDVAFNDGRRIAPDREAVLTLSLGPGALAKLGLPPAALETFPPAFLDGMTAPGRERILGDVGPNAEWWWGREPVDMALLVYGKSAEGVSALASGVAAQAEAGGHALLHRIDLAPVTRDARTGMVHEPFGFADGVSQPAIRGTYRGLRNDDPVHLIEPGEILLGYPDNRGNVPPGPQMDAQADPENCLPACADHAALSENIVTAPRDLGRNGSFLVMRQLEQDVPGFWRYCEEEAARLKGRLGAPYQIDSCFVAAKLVGRWPDGSSLVRYPYQPASGDRMTNPMTRSEPALPPPRAARSRADNDFMLGTEDPQGLRCPFGAHIRRANPRDSLDPGTPEALAITNRHRILRAGRLYQPKEGQQPGLLFICMNADIERQFEFIQQTWLNAPHFHGLAGEQDPLSGDGCAGRNGYTIATRDGPIRLKPMSQFVRARGGAYFFMPSKALLGWLAIGGRADVTRSRSREAPLPA